ncbi:MAG TPA: ABC transporter permease [Bacteroidales bacterium]|nr:ABC transporter permease [Bacteroidales bacterium]HSA43794.1 ABC transporter permease [Bacteroidales bacterium]
MIRFLLHRLFYGILVMFGVVTVVFLLFNVLPGDPARMMLGQRADISSVEAINRDLGRDKPLLTQYLNFLNDLSPLSLHHSRDSASYWYFDRSKYGSHFPVLRMQDKVLVLKEPYLRRSYQSKREVAEIIRTAFPATALLAVVSMLFAGLLGIVMGIVAALKRNSFWDRLIIVLSVGGMSLPSFFAAILIAWLFAWVLGDLTGLNMVGSMFEVDDFGRGESLSLQNLILPALTLGIRPLAVIAELSRSAMLDVMSQDYIRTARAKGLSQWQTITRHALRNVMNPVVTAVSGWFASLMAGAVFVEYVFDWKGLGVVMVEALEKYDFPVVMGLVLFVSLLLVVINILVDLVYAWLDPRIRLV